MHPVVLELWWAGHRLEDVSLDLKDVRAKLEELQEHIKKGTMRHHSCGTVFVVDELCVDIRYAGDVVPLTSYKNKS